MSQHPIPKWAEKQKLLYAKDHKIDVRTLVELGNSCLTQGFVQDAFEYYRAAKHEEGLKKLSEMAIAEGDAFLFASIEKQHAHPYSQDLWNKLGYKAHELGKFRFARTAFEKTANELMLAKIQATLENAAGPSNTSKTDPV